MKFHVLGVEEQANRRAPRPPYFYGAADGLFGGRAAGNGAMVTLLRVDDRLLHGQIICSWVPFVRAEHLLVVSDEAASDYLVREIISACGSSELGVLVKSVADTVSFLKDEADPAARFMIVVGELRDAMRLYETGLEFASINLGNIHHDDDGSRTVTPSIIVNSEDEKILKKLISLGVSIEIRDVPKNEPMEYVP